MRKNCYERYGTAEEIIAKPCKGKGKVSAYEPEGSSGRRLSPVSVAWSQAL